MKTRGVPSKAAGGLGAAGPQENLSFFLTMRTLENTREHCPNSSVFLSVLRCSPKCPPGVLRSTFCSPENILVDLRISVEDFQKRLLSPKSHPWYYNLFDDTSVVVEVTREALFGGVNVFCGPWIVIIRRIELPITYCARVSQ